MTHDAIWAAIDALAARQGVTISRLAQISDMDTTSFSKSKRFTRGGKPRWPSFGSVIKVLKATHVTWEEFIALIPRDGE